jgi:DNA-binding PadR family transcriptional regulator
MNRNVIENEAANDQLRHESSASNPIPKFKVPHMGPHGFTRFFILRLLKEEPRSGYDIMKALSKKTHGTWQPSSGIIYPTLMELEDRGLIEEVKVREGELTSGRGRRVYKITVSGEAYVNRWEEQRQEFTFKIIGWRRFWKSFWAPTLDEAIDELQENISIFESLSKETKGLPPERITLIKKVLEEASQKLGTLSTNL